MITHSSHQRIQAVVISLWFF